VVRNISDHPVCASKVASQLFLNRAATPPLKEGNSSIPPVLFRSIFCNSSILQHNLPFRMRCKRVVVRHKKESCSFFLV
jgi:hypothetical protein